MLVPSKSRSDQFLYEEPGKARFEIFLPQAPSAPGNYLHPVNFIGYIHRIFSLFLIS
jgi:hypothetical protein